MEVSKRFVRFIEEEYVRQLIARKIIDKIAMYLHVAWGHLCCMLYSRLKIYPVFLVQLLMIAWKMMMVHDRIRLRCQRSS